MLSSVGWACRTQSTCRGDQCSGCRDSASQMASLSCLLPFVLVKKVVTEENQFKLERRKLIAHLADPEVEILLRHDTGRQASGSVYVTDGET
ncbi:hypothetical protein MKX01_010311, partial [Papaver californicum]